MSDLINEPRPAVVRDRTLTGGKVLACLIAFFIVVASVNAVMMTIAVRTMPGVDTKSAYEASQTYNAAIARAREQDERGWRADVVIGRSGPDRSVRLELKDRNGAPVRKLDLQATLAHPADRKADLTTVMAEISPGIYQGAFAGVHEGEWNLQLLARDDEREMYRSNSRVKL